MWKSTYWSISIHAWRLSSSKNITLQGSERSNDERSNIKTSVDQNIVVQNDCMVVQYCQWLFRTSIFEQGKTDVTTLATPLLNNHRHFLNNHRHFFEQPLEFFWTTIEIFLNNLVHISEQPFLIIWTTQNNFWTRIIESEQPYLFFEQA